MLFTPLHKFIYYNQRSFAFLPMLKRAQYLEIIFYICYSLLQSLQEFHKPMKTVMWRLNIWEFT